MNQTTHIHMLQIKGIGFEHPVWVPMASIVFIRQADVDRFEIILNGGIIIAVKGDSIHSLISEIVTWSAGQERSPLAAILERAAQSDNDAKEAAHEH